MNPKNRKAEDANAKGGPMANAGANGSPNGSASALAKAVSLHLEGKRKEALQELKGAVAGGGDSAEFYSAMGHIQFELEQYEDTATGIPQLLTMCAKTPDGQFNLAVCLEKLGRWDEASERSSKSPDANPN